MTKNKKLLFGLFTVLGGVLAYYGAKLYITNGKMKTYAIGDEFNIYQ